MEALVWGAIFVGVWAIAALGGMTWMRGRLTAVYLDTHHEVAGFLFGVVGVVYAVLLAFIVIIVWQRYYDASQNAAQESNHVGDLWRLAEGFDPQTAALLRTEVIAYGRTVVDREWPAMAAHQESPESWRAFDRLWSTATAITPDDPREQALYEQTLDLLSALSDSRRLRLHDSEHHVPGVLWTALYGGAAVTVIFSYLFQLASFRLQLLMTGQMVALIALVLYVVLALSEPFAGPVRVPPDAMRAQVARMAGTPGTR